MKWLRVAATLLALGCAVPAQAVQPDEVLADSKLEARARILSRELRCMVCQNQSIDDSDAPLARDLRLLVRERLNAGDSDAQVIDFLVARYGEFVLLRPRFTGHNAVLWLVPPVLLIGGALALLLLARSKRAGARSDSSRGADLTATEKARLAGLMERTGETQEPPVVR